jgi:toxin ParE1/3/4
MGRGRGRDSQENRAVTPRVVLTREAVADVAEATAWYRGRSVRAAEEFLLAVNVALARIEAQPTAQVIVDAGTGARRALLRKFPHRVLYLIEEGRLVVFAVVHHRRHESAWRERLEEKP